MRYSLEPHLEPNHPVKIHRCQPRFVYIVWTGEIFLCKTRTASFKWRPSFARAPGLGDNSVVKVPYGLGSRNRYGDEGGRRGRDSDADLERLCVFVGKPGNHRSVLFSPIAGRVRIDPDLLYRVFDGLYSNLLKYTDRDNVVEVTCAREGQQSVLTMVNRISEITRQQEGTNFGLGICEQILKYHGGSFFTAESTDLPCANHAADHLAGKVSHSFRQKAAEYV